MKYTTKNRWSDGPGRVCRVALVSAVLMLSGITLQTRANSLNLDFTYTVVQGTCMIDVSPPSVTFTKLSSLLSTLIAQNWVVVDPQTLTVTLSGCTGAADPLTRPAIELTGTRANEASASQARKDSVFSDSGNTTGLGVVFAKDTGTTAVSNTNRLTPDASGRMFINTGAVNSTPGTGTSSYTIMAGLACGIAADCAASNLKVAKGSANVTFSFTYH